MEVLIVKNITREGPGLLEVILKEKGVGYDIIDLDEGKEFPDPTKYQALFVLGGPDSANDETHKIKAELSQIKRALDAKVPYLGICLGMQALVKASGGEVYPNAVREIGWHAQDSNFFEVELTEEGKTSPLFEGLISPLKIFHLHGETVRLTPEMTLLATGKFCHNQVVQADENAYGLQGHFELTEEMLNTWLDQDPDLQMLDRAAVKKDFQKIRSEYENTGRTILANFLKIANLQSS